MRVTKTVKEYIAKRVNEVYKPKITEIDLDYKCEKEKINKKIESAIARFEEELKAILADNRENYNWDVQERYGEKRILDWREVSDRNAENEFWQIKRRMSEEKEEAITNIIVELELGGDRETLEKMLAELK